MDVDVPGNDSSRRGRLTPAVLSAGVIVVAIALLITERWRFTGQVVDNDGQPVPDATVLVSLHSEQRRAPVPHAWTATTRCLDVVVDRTDHSGKFKVARHRVGLLRKNKVFSVRVFKPGWYQLDASRVDANTFFLAKAANARISMSPDRGQRWSFVHGGETTPLTGDPTSPLYEQTMSRSLTSAADLGNELSGCPSTGEIVVGEALTYALRNAVTRDEISYARNRCLDALQRWKSATAGPRLDLALFPRECAQVIR